VLVRAAMAEKGSEHPVGRAIVAEALARGLTPAPAGGFQALGGRGVRAEGPEGLVYVGTRALAAAAGLALPEAIAVDVDRLEADGHTVVLAGWDGRVRGALALADTVRPEAGLAVDGLRALGVDVVMLTGDNARTAASIGHRLGIDHIRAEVLPGEKAEEIARLQFAGHVVAMVGDGVNDAPALARADLGIAIGTGSDVAIESSDVTLLSGDLSGVVTALRLSRATYGTILENLGWAFGYNLVAIPLAALTLVSPVVAGAAMGLSSVAVVANSLRLHRFGRGRTARRTGSVATRRRIAAAWLAPAALLGAIAVVAR
jgi:cation transport ATPase